MGRARVSNMKIDYGNNSSISVPQKVFKVLAEEEILKASFLEEGYNQGGISDKPVAMTRYYGYLDSLKIGNLSATNLTIKTGKSGLIGREFLSRYIVAINWSEKELRFKPQSSWDDMRATFGYSIGLNRDEEPILFGVTKGSNAEKNGLKMGMMVLSVDTVDFTVGHSYCDYIDYLEGVKDSLKITVKASDGMQRTVDLKKELLSGNQ